jgi:hypothetical protein
MSKQKQVQFLLGLLLTIFLSHTAAFAAFPVKAEPPVAAPVAGTASGALSMAAPTAVQTVAKTAAAPEFEGVKAKGRQDPGVLSFILSMVALALLGLGGIVGGVLFSLIALVPAGFAIYYGVKGFNRTNKGFAIAGFVIGILVALSALGDIFRG